MKTSMKKLGTVLLTVALLISALGGFVYAADGNYVSLHVEKTSDTEVTVTVKTIQPIDDILSLNAKFTVPGWLFFQKHDLCADHARNACGEQHAILDDE